jgi:hypothetical protein
MTERSAAAALCAGAIALFAACDRGQPGQRGIRGEQPSDRSIRVIQEARSAERPRVGLPSDDLLQSLRDEPVAEVSKGRGGRSLSFRVTLADGTRAYFKPEQSFAAHWFSEVASFHIDRMLGLGRVAPVAARILPWSSLSAAAGTDERIAELRISADGKLRGALIAWIDGKVVPADLPAGWEAWLRVEQPTGATPFQRVGGWRSGKNRLRSNAAPPEPATPERAAELSDLVLFDHLIGNLDRWGGNFTNVRTLGAGGPLVHLDNANGFHRRDGGRDLLDAQLHAVQRFRRSTVEAIRAFDVRELERRLAREPGAPILDREQLDALEQRRERLLRHVAEMEREHGAEALPW